MSLSLTAAQIRRINELTANTKPATLGPGIAGGIVATGMGLGDYLQAALGGVTPQIVDPGRRSVNTMRVASTVVNGEKIVIGADTYNVDTVPGGSTPAGQIRVDSSGGSTRQAKGTLSIPLQPADGETITVDTKVYTFKAALTAGVDGQVKIGATVAVTQASLVAAFALTGVAGVDYSTGMTAHPTVGIAAFAANNAVLTAKAGGVAGNSIATTETMAGAGNQFDAATLGTTQAGVAAPAAEFTTNLVAAINASATESVSALRIGANEVLVYSKSADGIVRATTTTMAGTNNVWANTTMMGASTTTARSLALASRAATAAEAALGNMHFMFDFAPVMVDVLVMQASGAQRLWNGAINISGNRVTLDNSGATPWAATDVISVQVEA